MAENVQSLFGDNTGESKAAAGMREVPDHLLPGRLTPTAWYPPQELAFTEWETSGKAFRQRRLYREDRLSASLWHLGDWLVCGEGRWGERAAQAVDMTDFVAGSIGNVARVCVRFDPSRRVEGVSFWWHAEVLRLREDDQDDVLSRAKLEEWGRQEFREAIQAALASYQAALADDEAAEDEAADAAADIERETCPCCVGAGKLHPVAAERVRDYLADIFDGLDTEGGQ